MRKIEKKTLYARGREINILKKSPERYDNEMKDIFYCNKFIRV